MNYDIQIEEKIYINGVEFEDIHSHQLQTMIDDIDNEIVELYVLKNKLHKLLERKEKDDA